MTNKTNSVDANIAYANIKRDAEKTGEGKLVLNNVAFRIIPGAGAHDSTRYRRAHHIQNLYVNKQTFLHFLQTALEDKTLDSHNVYQPITQHKRCSP